MRACRSWPTRSTIATVLVTACGRLCLHRKKINISTVLAGQRVGIKEVDEGIWLVSFLDYDLGYIDLEQRTLQPLDNPFGPRLSPTHVSGPDTKQLGALSRNRTVDLSCERFVATASACDLQLFLPSHGQLREAGSGQSVR
jgi:hypothetical protein